MKKVLSLAIAAALAAPVAVMADATVYGQANLAVQSLDPFIDTNADGYPDAVGDTVDGIESYSSRVGVKGSEDLGDGLKAVYTMEFGVDMDGSGTLSGRNQFVGLASDSLGTILLGRHDSPLKMSQGNFDQFNDQPADIAGVMPGEDRFPNVAAYVSPSFAGFTFVGATVAGEDPANDYNSLNDHWSVAGMYSNGPFFVGLGYNNYKVGGQNPDLLRVTGTYAGDMFEVGLMYSDMGFDGIPGAKDSTAYGISGALKLGGGHKIKAQYLDGDSPVAGVAIPPGVELVAAGNDDSVTQWAVGYDYSLSKRSSVYVSYTEMELDSVSDNAKALSLGMLHKF